jgi:hypothetical protein
MGIYTLTESKIFLGLVMIVIIYGSKCMVNDNKYHDYIMQNTISKIVLFACAICTRDIIFSLILTFCYPHLSLMFW